MASKKGGEEPSLSKALLYTTMCIVGLPVEVQVKDGSLYSGIFHTACFEKDHGIVLKKARKIGSGKCYTNLELGDFVDTLIVLSSDLVQVVVKEFLLPAEGIIGHVGRNSSEVVSEVESRTCSANLERGEKGSTCEHIYASRYLDESEEREPLSSTNDEVHFIANEEINVGKFPDKASDNVHETRDARHEIFLAKVEEHSFVPAVSHQQRQVMGCRPEGEKHDEPIEEVVHEVHHSSPSSNANGTSCSSPAAMPVQLVSPESKDPTSTNFPLSDAKTSAFTTSTTMASDIAASPCPGRSASSDSSVPGKNKAGSISAKESKLNPSAKVFTPSLTNLRPLSTAVPSIVSPSQMSNNLPVMPTAGAQARNDMSSLASRFSVPSKVVPYSNLIAAHTGVGTPYTRPVLGHASVRQLPVRINGQYHPLQAGQLCLNPHSQMVMVGQLSQPAYAHPVSQDVIQRTLVVPQGQPHALVTQANAPKFQGSAAQIMQLPMNPPIVAGGNQTFVVPTHVPFSQSQPLSAIQPIMVPGGNGYLYH